MFYSHLAPIPARDVMELEPMSLDLKDQITKLAEKAVKTEDGAEAMRFSQAACNLANTMCAFGDANRK